MDKDLSLVTPMDDLEEKLLTSDDVDELTSIIDIFNINLKKRNIVRNKKLNDLQDKVVDRMLAKIEEEPWEFSNDDLIKFHKAIQDTISKSDTSIDKLSIPAIQVNNQQINISTPEFTRESRAKILSAVHEILNNDKFSEQFKNSLEEVEVIDED